MLSLFHLSFIPSLLSVLFTCLHLISIKNDLTPLEVVRAKRDEWGEKRQRRFGWYEERDYEMRHYKDRQYEIPDYEGVIDVLSRYSKEPSTLPSHDVSRFNTHNNYVTFTILPHIVQDRRLKSTEKKEQSRVIGQERDSVQKQKTKTTEDRPPDNQTTSTTVLS